MKSKRIVVVGAGVSGLAATRLLVSRGASVCLVDEFEPGLSAAALTELKQMAVDFRTGVTSLDFESWDLAITSPGVSPDSLLGAQLKHAEFPVYGEVELAFRCFRGKTVAITGTNGKTTTTRLLESIMLSLGWRAKAVGNIGYPYSLAVCEEPEPEWVSLEVSSFQLDDVSRFRPEVAVLLNLAPDHLDRYGSVESYYRSKAAIFDQQEGTNWAVIQYEAREQLRTLGVEPEAHVLTFSARDTRADLYYAQGYLVSRIPAWSGIVYDVRDGFLRGNHNAENLMAALLVAYTQGMPLSDVQLAMMSFRAEAHRFEILPNTDGVTYINDSKSTNPASMRAAIEACGDLVKPGCRLWLIAGGDSKRLSFLDLRSLVLEQVDGLFFFGESRDEMGAVLGRSKRCYLSETLDESLAHVFHHIKEGDVVLFSPACASFDQFQNYRERGQAFKRLIKEHSLLACQPGHSSETKTMQTASSVTCSETTLQTV